MRKQLKDYEERGKLTTDNGGSASYLDEHQTVELKAHLEDQLYMKAEDICESAANMFRVRYSIVDPNQNDSDIRSLRGANAASSV